MLAKPKSHLSDKKILARIILSLISLVPTHKKNMPIIQKQKACFKNKILYTTVITQIITCQIIWLHTVVLFVLAK